MTNFLFQKGQKSYFIIFTAIEFYTFIAKRAKHEVSIQQTVREKNSAC